MEETLFGKNYSINEIIEDEEKIEIHMKSKKHSCRCPKCSELSTTYHSTYTRTIQDTPLHCKETWLYIRTYKYDCLNKNCSCSTFVEDLDFAKNSQVKTDALLHTILAVAIFLSNSAASLILSLMGVKVSADTIKNIYDRIEIFDNPNIEEVGIDDVATRKGQKYATAIYDLKTHNLIALLEGRDAETLKEWLKSHTKIKLVARDRASAYAMALSEVLPDCVQVADRFHILQNLLERLKDIFYGEMPNEIFIKDGEILKEPPKKELDLYVDDEILKKLNYDNTLPIDEDGKEIKYDNKRRDLTSKQYQKHKKARLEKKNLIMEIQKRWNECENKDIKEIANEFSISVITTKKYISMKEEDINKLDNPREYKKRKTKIDNYVNIIYKMLKDDCDYKTIYSYVMYKGYAGTSKCLDMYIYLINKNNFPKNKSKTIYHGKLVYPKDITVIKRNELLKYILTINTSKSKNKEIEKNINIIRTSYPIVEEVEKIFKEFHSILMGNKIEDLDIFLETYKSTKIRPFCEGIKKDITAVKNAISSDISSGFVEGNNNKFKLIKRIIYGKAKLVNLFRKCYVAFIAKNESFSVSELI